MEIEVNFLAILLATVASMAIGYLWYGSESFGFGKAWAKAAKLDIAKSSTPLALIAAAVSAAVMASALAILTYVFYRYFGGSFLATALVTSLFVWVSFQGLRMFQRAKFNQDSNNETMIHLGNELTTVIVAAAVIGLFGI